MGSEMCIRDRYKDEVWKGFDMAEIISIIFALGCIAGVVFVLYKKFGISPSSAVYIGVPVSFPILVAGFYKYQGYMTLSKLIQEIYWTHECKELVFSAGERKEPFGHFFFLKRRKGKKK